MTIFEDYNLKTTDVISYLKNIIHDNREAYRCVRLRGALSINKGEWSNFFYIARVFTSEELTAITKPKVMQYKETILFEKHIKIEDLEFYVNKISEGDFLIDGNQIDLESKSKSWHYSKLPSHNEYMIYPGYMFELEFEKPPGNYEKPLLDYALPYFPDVYEAIRHWSEIKNFHGANDGRLGSAFVILPECRVYIDRIVIDKSKIKLTLKSFKENLPDVIIKGGYSLKNSIIEFDYETSDGDVEIEIPQESEHIEFYLIDRDNTVYDFHQEIRFWSKSQRRVLTTQIRGEDDIVAVEEAIRKGEGPNIEFKPFIKVGDNKIRELIKTTIAFANTSGGIILIGIDNACIITGVEKEIRGSVKKDRVNLEQAYTEYIGGLRQAINGDLNTALDLDIKKVDIANNTVILIRVPEGKEKPHFNIHTKEVFIRRGANSVRADPKHDLPHLYKSNF